SPEAVRCFLCTSVHGAMKQTTCKRFAHLPCLLFAPGSRIGDLKNKQRID
ncbi:unnamed protein product, partial [Hapterophycus canaliculatus]